MVAAVQGNINVFEVMIKKTVNVHLKQEDGSTALHTAARHDHDVTCYWQSNE